VKRRRSNAFDVVIQIGLTLPHVEAVTRCDGSFYRPYPLVLVRLDGASRDALRELLSASYRLTLPKTRLRRRHPSA
jgi:hypothetical protein